MAYVVMAYVVMAYIVMAYIVMRNSYGSGWMNDDCEMALRCLGL